jgi:signal transduction histidine kinase
MNIIKTIVFVILCLSCQYLFAQNKIDSAKNLIFKTQKIDSNYFQTCFFIADEYMNLYRYDSAQVWLSRINENLPQKSTTRSNYFLISRQAEVYYYNNLLQLGLQESRRSLNMAKLLNDSLLMADSYNFLGLFYSGLDSIQKSITFFKNGLQYIRQPPYPSGYIELSLPHHLYGNLAEAYQKLKKYDSSIYYIKRSLFFANEINHSRGTSVAYVGLADVFFDIRKVDSAKINYQKGMYFANLSGDFDVLLLCLSGIAKCESVSGNKQLMLKNLEKGFSLLKKQNNINRFYTLIFLSTAIDLLKKEKFDKNIIYAFELKSKIENSILNESNSQLGFILEDEFNKERRLVNLQILESQRKQELANTRLILAIVVIVILLIGFLVYRFYQNQVLTVSRVRNTISQDLHDEIGASLSSLQIYGAVAEQLVNSNPSKALEMIHNIKNQSREIMETMSDIVWSMKNNDTGNLTLETKIKNFAVSILQEKNIHLSFIIQPEAELSLYSMKARRNILLIIRELINNTIKHSMANNIRININLQDRNWIMLFYDDGIGFNKDKSEKTGHGLVNIQNRCIELNGTYSIDTTNGTQYLFTFPLQIISNSGW